MHKKTKIKQTHTKDTRAVVNYGQTVAFRLLQNPGDRSYQHALIWINPSMDK